MCGKTGFIDSIMKIIFTHKFIFLLLTILFYYHVSVAQQVIGSLGGEQTNEGIILNATLGEVAIDAKNYNKILLTEGFHQHYFFLTKTKNIVNPAITIFPNPVNDIVHVKFGESEKIKKVELYDISGRILMQKFTPESSTKFNLNNLPSGLFILKVTEESNLSYTLKVIKL